MSHLGFQIESRPFNLIGQLMYYRKSVSKGSTVKISKQYSLVTGINKLYM